MALTLDAEHNRYKQTHLFLRKGRMMTRKKERFFFWILDLRLEIKDRHLGAVAMADTRGHKLVTNESARNEFGLLNWLAHSSPYPCAISPLCFLMS